MLHVHLPVLQPGLQLYLIISINFMVQVTEKSGWVAFPFLYVPAPFKFFRHKSACTAFPVLRLTMYSLTAYLFTKSHIAECIKIIIWLLIIERNKKNHHGHSNTVAPAVNSIISPCNTVAQVVKVPGFSSTVPPYVTNLPCPSSTDSLVVSNLPG